MKAIPIGGVKGVGKYALVDDGDFDVIAAHNWHIAVDRYARTWVRVCDGRFVMYMHHAVAGFPLAGEVDHANGNGLDNRRENLRFASVSENQANQRRSYGRSPFKGVSGNRRTWRAVIQKNGRQHRLGSFDSEIEAALAYDRAALELFGEFACTNILGKDADQGKAWR